VDIDWTNFTPWHALAGGALIGLAASALALLNGRIAGISGILAGALAPRPGDTAWRYAFLFGMMIAPALYAAFTGGAPTIEIDADFPALAIAGLLVGLGTRYGCGCTSGHGVCGLSRLSPRSLVATLCFMATGFATVFLARHVLGG